MSIDYVAGLRPKNVLDEKKARQARIDARRLVCALGIQECIARLGRSESTIRGYLAGRSAPSPRVWAKIKFALDQLDEMKKGKSI